MLREVRGLGTLVPEDIRWIPATTQGRVERIVLRPGTAVDGGQRHPGAEQSRSSSRSSRTPTLKLKAAEAALANLRVQLQNE